MTIVTPVARLLTNPAVPVMDIEFVPFFFGNIARENYGFLLGRENLSRSFRTHPADCPIAVRALDNLPLSQECCAISSPQRGHLRVGTLSLNAAITDAEPIPCPFDDPFSRCHEKSLNGVSGREPESAGAFEVRRPSVRHAPEHTMAQQRSSVSFAATPEAHCTDVKLGPATRGFGSVKLPCLARVRHLPIWPSALHLRGAQRTVTTAVPYSSSST